jgi:hypothetical protein
VMTRRGPSCGVTWADIHRNILRDCVRQKVKSFFQGIDMVFASW